MDTYVMRLLRYLVACSIMVFAGLPTRASDLCTALGYYPGGGLTRIVREALRAEGLYDGPMPPDKPDDPTIGRSLHEALVQYAERHKVTTLSQDRGDGQFVEDVAARHRASMGLLEETKQSFQTPWGELTLSHFHVKGNPGAGAHSRITFGGRAYVGLSGECQPPSHEIDTRPLPRLHLASSSTPGTAGKGSLFEVFLYDQDVRRILVVTREGLWLSHRQFLVGQYSGVQQAGFDRKKFYGEILAAVAFCNLDLQLDQYELLQAIRKLGIISADRAAIGAARDKLYDIYRYNFKTASAQLKFCSDIRTHPFLVEFIRKEVPVSAGSDLSKQPEKIEFFGTAAGTLKFCGIAIDEEKWDQFLSKMGIASESMPALSNQITKTRSALVSQHESPQRSPGVCSQVQTLPFLTEIRE